MDTEDTRVTALLPPAAPLSDEVKLANRLRTLAHDVRCGKSTESERAVIDALLRSLVDTVRP